jgi:amino acid adenylation domain-containing protein
MNATANIDQMRLRALDMLRGGARAVPVAESAPAALPPSFSHGMTPVQQGIWFQEQLHPGSGDAHIAVALRLTGALDPVRLAHAIDSVTALQPALRSCVVPGAPARLMIKPHGAPLALLVPDGDPEAQLLREARRPFDFSGGTLFRSALLPLGDNQCALLLTAHHLVFDGWSMSVLVSQLSAAYTDGAVPALAGTAGAYQRWFDTPPPAATPETLAYWRSALAQCPERLSLPADRAPAATCFAHAELGRADVDALDRTCRERGWTRFPLLAAALAAVLGRYGNQGAVTLGFPLTVRPRAELQAVAGNFLQTLPLPVALDGNTAVDAAVELANRSFVGALAHGGVALADLVRHCLPDQEGPRGNVFDALLNLTNFAMSTFDAPGIACTPFSDTHPELLGLGGAKFPLTVYCEPLADGGLRLRAVGMGAHYSSGRLALVLAQMQAILRQMVQALAAQAAGAAVAAPVLAAMSLRTPACRALLPDPGQPLPLLRYPTVLQSFLQLARRQPDAPALQWRGSQWTYAELAAVAADGAGVLAPHTGAGHGQPPVVAILGQRCPGVVAAALAAWMAGAVVMLVDGTLPPARVQSMLEASGASLGIALGDAAFPAMERLTVLQWDEMARPAGPVAVPGQLPAGGDAAYLAFTSGSTGKPKAILGSHNGLAQFLDWQRGLSGIGPGDRVANFTSLSFDVVLRELFLPLTSGAALCIPDQPELGPSHVAQFLATARITLLHTVPTLATLWLQRWPDEAAGGKLRAVFFAGEPLSDTVVARWRRRFPGCVIYNLYGPTETTLAKCAAQVPDPAPAGIQSIGGAIAGSQALVLGAGAHLCGRGELGEIVIRSPYRSHGYVAGGVPQPTFIANPWCDDEGGTLYRTGDLGRYGLDGRLEILGRRDDQVKINGVRIELAEVRAALQACPGIADAYVTVAEQGGVKQLVGVAVAAPAADGAQAVTAASLGASLRARLPAAMVPSRLVLADELPRNANGKIDRQRLLHAAAAAAHAPAGGGGGAAPVAACGNHLEQTIHDVWCDALGQAAIGPDTNFFDAGGHSLLLLDVQHRLQQALGRDVAAVHLFQHPTIRALAAFLAPPGQVPAQAAAPAPRPAGRSGAGQAAQAARRARLAQSRQQN